MIKFAEPLWLLGSGASALVVACLWFLSDRRQGAALAAFASSHLHQELTSSLSVARRWWRRGLVLGSLVLLFVAMARPQWGFRWQEIKREGVEILFALDTSKSMLTPDVKPDRLTRSKLAVADFVQKLDGDEVGMIAFAGTAFLECPVTSDYEAFNETLGAIDTNTIPRGGTDITRAIQEAEAAFQQHGSKEKILVLLTDGEDLEGDCLATAAAAAKEGVKIYTIGVGTTGGDLIPVEGGGYMKDGSGQLIKSRLDESMLRSIASATGGIYAPLGASGQGLETVYDQAIAPLAKRELASRQEKVYNERFQWPLAGALIMLLSSLFIGTRRRRPTEAQRAKGPTPAPRGLSSLSAGVVLILLVVVSPERLRASPESAQQAFAQGDYARALEEYTKAVKQNPSKAELQYNLGAAAYKSGDFGQAIKAFETSLSAEQKGDAKRLAEQESAYYNLGNALYREGQKSLQSKPQDTIQAWEKAVQSYDAALQLGSKDPDATFNKGVVQRQLDELKKQQPPSPENSQDKKDDKNKNENKSKDQNNGKNQQSNKNSNQDNQDQKGGADQQNQGAQQSSGDQSKPPASPKPDGSPGQEKNSDPNSSGKAPQSSGTDSSGKQLPPTERKPENPGTDPSASSGKPEDEKHAAEQRVPGGLTQEEARELLDAMKDEAKRYPVVPAARTNQNNQTSTPSKDW